MNNKYCFIFTSLVCLLYALCSSAQTVIYNENFDADSTALPLGWSAYPSSGWEVETVAPSTGYPGASGLVNVVIRNTDSTNVYYLYSKDISTVGLDSITVSWGARLTTNFMALGSNIQSFDFSTDSGVTWTNVVYTENANTNLWNLDNDSTPICLPANAGNQPAIRFRWIAQIVNAVSGNYRIDDFIVSSLAIITGYGESNSRNFNTFVYPNPASSSITITTDKSGVKEVRLYDNYGKKLADFFSTENKINIDRNNFPDGYYIIEVLDEMKKLILNSKLILN